MTKMTKIYILQKKVTKGIAPAIDTFVMEGFSTPEECKDLWCSVTHCSDICTVMELSEYLQISPVRRFFDETGSAGLIKKTKRGCTMSTITPLISRLLTHDVMVIDVVDTVPGKYIYSQNSVKDIPDFNKTIKDTLLLGRDYIGSYIYMHGSSEDLDEFIEKSMKMSSAIEFLVLYINPRLNTVQEVESKIWTTQHQSIFMTEHSIMQLDIIDTEFRFKVLEDIYQEVIVSGIY